MDISFSIVTYNSGQVLHDCLKSLVDSLGHSLEYEIFVVDNGSVDESTAELQNTFPNVHWIQNALNVGYTRAMNQGLKACSGKFCVQLNPDVIVPANTFQHILDFMLDQPDVGICTPKVLNPDGTLQKQCHRSYARPWDVISYFLHLDRLFPHSRFFGGYLLTYLPENEIADVQAVSGSCMVIRSQVFDDIGYLDEQFFAYQEDTDFCFRANNKGWRIVYFPHAEITHLGGMGGSLSQPLKAIYAWHKSYLIYYQKHLAKDYFFLFNWLMYFAMVLKLLSAYLRFFLTRQKVVGTRKP